MGLLEKFRKRQAETVPETKQRVEMGIEDFDAWLKATFGVRESEASDSLARACADIETGFLDAGIALGALEKAKMRTEGDMCTRMNMIKGSFATKAGASLASAPRLHAKSWDGFMQFIEGARRVAIEAGDVSPKQGYVLSTYFRGEGTAFSESIRRIGTSIDALSGRIQDLAFLGTLRDARNGINELSEMKTRKETMIKKIAAAATNIKAAEKSLAEARAKTNAIIASKAWKDAQKKKQTLETLQSEIMGLEARLRMDTGGVSRLMKKLAHETADKDAEEFSEQPLSALATFSKPRLESLFARADSAVKNGELDVKDSDKKRMRVLMDAFPAVMDARAKLAGLKKNEKSIGLEIEGSEPLAEIREMHATVARLESGLERLLTEEKTSREQAISMAESMDEKRKCMESLMAKEGHAVWLKI